MSTLTFNEIPKCPFGLDYYSSGGLSFFHNNKLYAQYGTEIYCNRYEPKFANSIDVFHTIERWNWQLEKWVDSTMPDETMNRITDTVG